MGKCSCKVKFGSFKWNRAGYAEVMNSEGVQSMVRQHASATLASANGSFSPDGDETGYAMRQAHGILANGYTVGITGINSRNHNARHNTLLKALQ